MVSIETVKGVDLAALIAQTSHANVVGADRTLQQCMLMSYESWIGMVDGKAACIWGLIAPTLLSDRAYLWLLTTELVKEHQFLFVRHSQRVVEQMLNEFGLIVGHCIVGEDRSIRWLQWLGAVFGEPEGKKIPFVIRKKDS